MPKVSICVLTYGDYPRLSRQVIESIRTNCPRSEYELIVGANAIGNDTAQHLERLEADNEIDHLVVSQQNLNKCPMMRQMFREVQTEFIWWFDDDSLIQDPDAFNRWLGTAAKSPEQIVMWGQMAWCNYAHAFAPGLPNAVAFVRSAPWYRGLPPPSWKPGGKGQFDFQGRGTGDGRWIFLVGGCWLIRTSAVLALDWPDKRLSKMGDDTLLGEAIRQQGWDIMNIDNPGIAISTESRRGESGASYDRSSNPVLL
jgi:GT2 family glycosyltransferase